MHIAFAKVGIFALLSSIAAGWEVMFFSDENCDKENAFLTVDGNNAETIICMSTGLSVNPPPNAMAALGTGFSQIEGQDGQFQAFGSSTGCTGAPIVSLDFSGNRTRTSPSQLNENL